MIANSLAKEPRKNVTALKTSSANVSAEETVSAQLGDLNKEVMSTLGRLNSLIDNRSAWADGIDGCREAVTLLRSMQGRLHSIVESTNKVEADLISAQADNARWNKMHADLTLVEGDLRAECARLRETNATVVSAGSELRAEHEKLKAMLTKQSGSLSNVRALAQELVREIG